MPGFGGNINFLPFKYYHWLWLRRLSITRGFVSSINMFARAVDKSNWSRLRRFPAVSLAIWAFFAPFFAGEPMVVQVAWGISFNNFPPQGTWFAHGVPRRRFGCLFGCMPFINPPLPNYLNPADGNAPRCRTYEGSINEVNTYEVRATLDLPLTLVYIHPFGVGVTRLVWICVVSRKLTGFNTHPPVWCG
jgi:hypothetical protein